MHPLPITDTAHTIVYTHLDTLERHSCFILENKNGRPISCSAQVMGCAEISSNPQDIFSRVINHKRKRIFLIKFLDGSNRAFV